jgi:geranylgeranyl reductase family protein
MDKLCFDTVIIGGGPAGSSCALTLQNYGLTSCVIDKCKFPRPKLCAGLLTVKTRLLLRRLLPNESEREFSMATGCTETRTFRLFDRNKSVASVDIEPSIIMTERSRFDDYLLGKYKQCGGTVLEGQSINSFDFTRRIVKLKNGLEVEYRYLVAADGANSLTSQATREKRLGNALCVETEISSDELNTDGVCAYFNVVPKSYAWTFKKGDHISVGMIKLKGMNFNLKEKFLNFLKFLGIDHPANYPIKGAMLPMNNFDEDPTFKGSVLFAGDAGGFVDPLTGEGIYFALKSGMLAAESLLQSTPCATYRKNLLAVNKKLKSDGRFARLLYTPAFMHCFLKNLHKYDRFLQYFYTTHIDGLNADGIMKTFIKYKLLS